MATDSEELVIGSVGQIIPVESSLEYRWEICNYASECGRPTGEKLVSPSFSIDNNSESLWNLELYPNGYNNTNAGYLVILLATNNDSSTGVRFKFCIMDGKKRVIHVHQSNEIAVSRGVKTGAVLTKTSDLLERADEILVKGKLTILYEICINRQHGDHEKPLTCLHRLKQFDKYENMLNNKKYSDLKFVIDGKKIYAHKAIVTSGSVVFAAMLEHKMRESMNNTIVIEDAAYNVFKELLRFMYCGKVQRIDEIADQLLTIADKYELLELKDICEKSLCETLTVEKVISFLKLADLHHANKLRGVAVHFIVTRAKDLIEAPDFNTILHLDEGITMEIMRGLVARQAK